MNEEISDSEKLSIKQIIQMFRQNIISDKRNHKDSYHVY